ncbi:protein NRT1/ PTR FAMILY 1.3-like isoform X1 [Salvia divinorum]|uniref:Protein NRT1/ PTR FAMILY 1.3-like isoform X1 n=1 Tax=Salvia divinorum TaxID=28513 RepID=A0ABD1H5P7_SALDI
MYSRQVVVRLFHKYITGSKTSFLFIILGLIWSFKIVEKAFLNILITRLSAGKMYDLRSSVVLVNSLELISVVLVVISTYATNVYRSRFMMVVLSTAVFIVGSILSGQLNLWLFYAAMALAHAAVAVTLKVFLENQLRTKYRDVSERQQLTKFWWTMVSALAAIFNQVSPLSGFHLKKLAKFLVIAMGCFFVVFLLGFEHYNDDGESSHNVVASIAKSKRPVNILSLCVCLSILNLVSAAGSAFFFLEAITLAVRDYLPVIILLDNVTRLTEFAVSESSGYLLKKLGERKRYNLQKMELLRIGMGMWCCVLCCNFAVGASTHRKYGPGGGEMSVYWLIPQFVLLGLMRGLAKDGFQSLYRSQAESQFKGWALGELARGAGSLLSMICVYIFNGRHFRWLEKNVGSSSLNKYYSFLAVLSVGNAMFYCWVAAWYLAWPFLVRAGDKRPTVIDSRTHAPQAKASQVKVRDKRHNVMHTTEARPALLVNDRDKRPRGATANGIHTREGSSWTYNSGDKKPKGNKFM